MSVNEEGRGTEKYGGLEMELVRGKERKIREGRRRESDEGVSSLSFQQMDRCSSQVATVSLCALFVYSISAAPTRSLTAGMSGYEQGLWNRLVRSTLVDSSGPNHAWQKVGFGGQLAQFETSPSLCVNRSWSLLNQTQQSVLLFLFSN